MAVSADNLGSQEQFLGGAVTVVRRMDDFMAYVGENRAEWGAGKTVHEAIGDVVLHHPESVMAEVTALSIRAAVGSALRTA